MSFPAPDSGITTYTNPDTGYVYEKNPTTGAWRRVSITDDTDTFFVKKEGDTMTGDLIQTPSSDATPSVQGELATAADDDEIEFRFIDSNDTLVCASLPFSPCGKTVPPVISIDGSTDVFADYGEELKLDSDGVVPNATLTDQVWQYQEAGASDWNNSSASAPPANYTVQTADQGRLFRVAQNFSDDTTGEVTEVTSNAISVTNQPPPISEWIAWTHTGGAAQISITKFPGTDSAKVYKNDGSSWSEVDEVRISSKNLSDGTYLIESVGLRSISFRRSSANILLTLDPSSSTGNLVSMANAFQSLTNFNQDLTSFDWSSVETWDDAFSGCTSYNANVNGLIGTTVTSIARMFKSSGFDQPVNTWDVSSVVAMNGLFEGSPFNQSLAGWDTGSVISFAAMFMRTTAFDQSVDSFDISSAQNMTSMFNGSEKYNQPIFSWVFPAGTDVTGMFANTKEFNNPLTFNTAGLTGLVEFFYGAEKFNDGSIDGWDVSSVTTLYKTFAGTKLFNHDLNNWTTTSLQNLSQCFNGAEQFNGNIGSWNTSGVTNMELTFGNAKKFNKSIANWSTGMVENFKETFYYCETFNQPLNNWNTSSATTMNKMFYRSFMFNQPLDKWSTGSVLNMEGTFQGTYVFDQDISSWCVPNIPTSPANFSGSSSAGFRDVPNDKHPVWGTCPPRILTSPVIK